MSNCAQHRVAYLNELAKYLPIDIHGKCGKFKCPESLDPSRSAEIKCREYISQKYKFFFVFENAICNGYITEK